jgi:MazG family protein
MPTLKEQVLDPSLTPFEQLIMLFAVLRSEQGCAWDRKQTHKSLLPYLLEEGYEVIEAVETEDDKLLKEELGDLLCQIVFHAQLAKERQVFTIDEVITRVVTKLVDRHPHVFGEQTSLTPQQVRDQWEKRKIETKEKKSVLGGVPFSMPALTLAFRMGEKAGGVGFDWREPKEVLEKTKEELAEIEEALASSDKKQIEEEIGDLLFALASFARKLDIDPEQALKGSLRKFKARFEQVEAAVEKSGRQFADFDLPELESLWQQAKKAE